MSRRNIHPVSKLRRIFAVSSPCRAWASGRRSWGRLGPAGSRTDRVRLRSEARRATMRGLLMLRAALIGFGSSGKTTLFQLMTSARETARAAHGKGEASIGISKVPDAPARSADGDVQPEEARAGDRRVLRSRRDRARPAARKALVDVVGVQERRRARPRAARVSAIRPSRILRARSIPLATRRRWRTS